MSEFKATIGHSLYAIGAFLLLFTVTLMQPVNIIYAKAINASEVIELSNQARSRFSKSKLSINQDLMSAAQTKAEDMATRRYFAHYGPAGETPWQFMNDAGYSYEKAGENLAITNESAERVIEGWLNSPTHKENLLGSDYYDTGVGIAYYGDYKSHKNTTVVVVFYGKSKHKSLFTGKEPTAPAGTTAALQGGYLNSLNPNLIVAIAVALIIAGLGLEIRHIRQHHHRHRPSI